MPFPWTTFRTGVRTAIGAAWPEVLPGASGGGIPTVGRIERLSLEGIRLPFASVDYGTAEETDEYGITNQSYLINTGIYYVIHIDQSNDYEEVVAAKLETLEDYLLTTGLPTGQVIRVTVQDVTPNDRVAMLILDKQKPFYAGAVTAQALVGETNA